MSDLIPFDWFVLFLRLALLALLYLFLWQLVRVTLRELIVLSRREDRSPSPPTSTARLIVVDPAASGLPIGASLAVGHLAVVGRHAHCDVVIDEPYVSGTHAEISAMGGQWFVRDLDSTNGTFVNGASVEGYADIQPGDIVQFGRVRLEFVP